MQTLRLAYRDRDRLPVLVCIREIAQRYYDVGVELEQIRESAAYEAALFEGACEVIVERLEYLYREVSRGTGVTMFCAPSLQRGLALVVPSHVNDIDALRGQTLAVRASGRPTVITLWLRMLGLERHVELMLVQDDEVGRWGQWKKVASGACIGAFLSTLYLPEAVAGGLKVLPVPSIPVVAHYSQASLSSFARSHDDLMYRYVKAVIHAICLMMLRREEALSILCREPAARLGLADQAAVTRHFDCIVQDLQLKPFPTSEAIANMYEIARVEFGAGDLNPLSLWDLHWVKQLDDAGFIDARIHELGARTPGATALPSGGTNG